MIVPQIIETNEKKIVGIRKEMSLIENETFHLWKEFRASFNVIPNRIGTHFFSIQNYPKDYFSNFDPGIHFEKWAAVEVTDHGQIPPNMESMILPSGLFAVFHYVGSSADTRIFQYIYGQWLPQSSYLLDERPHFEFLGEKYKNNDLSSEEDIWIPIKLK